jgi:hypothetical protein
VATSHKAIRPGSREWIGKEPSEKINFNQVQVNNKIITNKKHPNNKRFNFKKLKTERPLNVPEINIKNTCKISNRKFDN